MLVEHLAQVGDEGLVGAQTLARAVRQLGHRLAVAARQLHDDVQRRELGVVGELGADAEAGLHAVGEMAVQVQRLGHRQRVREHQALGARVDAQLGVMGQRLFAPLDRIAGIVAQAVEQLGEIQVEVAQEGVHADHVGERRAEVAAVFLHPVFQRLLLEVAQAHLEGLEGLHVFVGHGPDRHQVEFLGQVDVRGALEELRQLARSVSTTSSCHSPEKRRRTPKSKNSKGLAGASARGRRRAQFGDLLRQAPASLRPARLLVEAAEIQLVDDIEHEDLEAHHVHDRAAGADAQVRTVGRDLDELALEAEQGQEVGEVALDEAQRRAGSRPRPP
jgi:hypothetical protein